MRITGYTINKPQLNDNNADGDNNLTVKSKLLTPTLSCARDQTVNISVH